MTCIVSLFLQNPVAREEYSMEEELSRALEASGGEQASRCAGWAFETAQRVYALFSRPRCGAGPVIETPAGEMLMLQKATVTPPETASEFKLELAQCRSASTLLSIMLAGVTAVYEFACLIV